MDIMLHDVTASLQYFTAYYCKHETYIVYELANTDLAGRLFLEAG